MRRSLMFGLVLTASIGVVSQASAALVGYYPFNRNADDASGLNIDLNLEGDAGFGDSVHAGLGSALSLGDAGGAGGAIGENFVKFTTNSVTVVAWAYAESVAGDWNTIVKNWGDSAGGQFHLGLGNQAANTLQNHIPGNGPATATTDFPVGEWVHVAFVLDAGAGAHRLYMNGAEVITAPAATYNGTLGPGNPVITGLGIGHKPNDTGTELGTNGGGPWNGLIDEVGLYDEALTTAQILQIYQNGLAGIQLDGTSVPEPSSLAGALLVSLGLVGYSIRRRSRARS